MGELLQIDLLRTHGDTADGFRILTQSLALRHLDLACIWWPLRGRDAHYLA